MSVACLFFDPFDRAAESVGSGFGNRFSAELGFKSITQNVFRDVFAGTVVVDGALINEHVFFVEKVNFRRHGRAQFVGVNVAFVDQNRKFIIFLGVQFDDCRRFGEIGIDAYKVDAFGLIIGGDLIDSLVITSNDRTLR